MTTPSLTCQSKKRSGKRRKKVKSHVDDSKHSNHGKHQVEPQYQRLVDWSWVRIKQIYNERPAEPFEASHQAQKSGDDLDEQHISFVHFFYFASRDAA